MYMTDYDPDKDEHLTRQRQTFSPISLKPTGFPRFARESTAGQRRKPKKVLSFLSFFNFFSLWKLENVVQGL